MLFETEEADEAHPCEETANIRIKYGCVKPSNSGSSGTSVWCSGPRTLDPIDALEVGGPSKDLVNAKVHVKNISQIVRVGLWFVGRTEMVLKEGEEDSASGGYTATSYTEALESSLIPIYTPETILQQDNVRSILRV